MRNSRTVWTIAKRTAPLCAVMGTLHDGINISVYENNSKWFSRMRSHIVWLIYSTVYQSYMCHGSYYICAGGCSWLSAGRSTGHPVGQPGSGGGQKLNFLRGEGVPVSSLCVQVGIM